MTPATMSSTMPAMQRHNGVYVGHFEPVLMRLDAIFTRDASDYSADAIGTPGR